jgi:hypothetical protein
LPGAIFCITNLFRPDGALTAQDSDKNPKLRALLGHASATANFLVAPPRRVRTGRSVIGR